MTMMALDRCADLFGGFATNPPLSTQRNINKQTCWKHWMAELLALYLLNHCRNCTKMYKITCSTQTRLRLVVCSALFFSS